MWSPGPELGEETEKVRSERCSPPTGLQPPPAPSGRCVIVLIESGRENNVETSVGYPTLVSFAEATTNRVLQFRL